MSLESQTTNVLFYGIGGQGILTAAEICALAAINEGYHVKKSEVKGMAQRGGSVESYVRFGKEVFSPLPLAQDVDLLVCLHQQEYERLKDQLKPQGVDLVSYLKLAKKAVGGERLFLNTYMIGVVSANLEISKDSWFKAMSQKFKREQEKNREFFLLGRAAGGINDL